VRWSPVEIVEIGGVAMSAQWVSGADGGFQDEMAMRDGCEDGLGDRRQPFISWEAVGFM